MKCFDLVKILRGGADMSIFKNIQTYRGVPGGHMKAPLLDLPEEAVAKLIEDIKLLREAASDLLDSVDRGMEVKAEIRNLERGVDSMMEDYNQRETIMKGFGGEPAEE